MFLEGMIFSFFLLLLFLPLVAPAVKFLQGKKSLVVTNTSMAIILSLVGCASIQPPPVDIQPASQYRLFQEREGLKISLEPFTDKDRVKKYFGTDLLAEGVLPILVIAENHNDEHSFFLSKDSILLDTLFTAEVKEVPSLQKREQELEALGDAYVPAALPLRAVEYNPDLVLPATVVAAVGGVLVYNQIATARRKDVVEYNIVEKEWLDKTLYPGGSHHGFVYFRVQKHTLNDVSAVFLKVKNVTSGDVLTFAFSVSNGRD